MAEAAEQAVTPERTARALEKIRALYAALPQVPCKGLCAQDCVQVEFTEAERTLLPVDYPHFTPETRGTPCILLDGDGRCSVYQDRPGICRIYGATRNAMLRCPHGCEPEDGAWLDNVDMSALYVQLHLWGNYLDNLVDPETAAVSVRFALTRPELEAPLRRRMDNTDDVGDEYEIGTAIQDCLEGRSHEEIAKRIAKRHREVAHQRRKAGGVPPDLGDQLVRILEGRDFETIEEAVEATEQAMTSLLPEPYRPRAAPRKGKRTKKARNPQKGRQR